MAQSRSYSCDKRGMRQARCISQSWSSNSSRPLVKIKVILSRNYLEHLIVYMQEWIISITFISKDYISLPALCQILIDATERIRSSISRSLGRDVYGHLITLMCHTVLMIIILVLLRIILIPLNYGYSKFAIQLFQSDNHYPL
jgi:hypothetical protein